MYLVRKNKGADRNIPPPGLSDPSVMSSAFFLLLQLLQPYMEGRPGHEGSLSSFPAGAMFLGVCSCLIVSELFVAATGGTSMIKQTEHLPPYYARQDRCKSTISTAISIQSSSGVQAADIPFSLLELFLSSCTFSDACQSIDAWFRIGLHSQGTTSGRLDTYYGAGRLGGAPGHLMKTLVPKSEDAAASVAIRPVRETSSSSQASQSQSPGLGHSGYSNSSASSSGTSCLGSIPWMFPSHFSLHDVLAWILQRKLLCAYLHTASQCFVWLEVMVWCLLCRELLSQ